MQQQIHHHHHQPHHQHQHQGGLSAPPQASPTGRSLSPSQLGGAPHNGGDPNAYFFQHGPYHPQFPHRNMFESSSQFLTAADLYPASATNNTASGGGGSKYPFEHSPLAQFYPAATGASNGATVQTGGPNAGSGPNSTAQDNGKLLDGLNSFGLGSVGPYPASQYQHLLVAN